jgi:hypothetical protein
MNLTPPKSVFNCIDPSLIPLFDDAAMMDEDILGSKTTTRSMSVQVIRETIEWGEIADANLATRISVSQIRICA